MGPAERRLRLVEDRTGWSIWRFVRTARRYRTVQIRGGQQLITAADPIPAALRDALAEVNRPEERRVRQHWAVMAKDLIQTGLFILLMVVIQTYLPADPLIHNLTFYLSLAAVVRFTVQVIQWWMERIVITDKRVMRPPACSTTRSA